MKNQFWAVGRWSWLVCEINGSGPIMSNFFGQFFHFFGVKKNFWIFFENTIASALKSCIEKRWKKRFFFLGRFFFSEKLFFFRAKIWVEFECKYREVGNRLLLAILWIKINRSFFHYWFHSSIHIIGQLFSEWIYEVIVPPKIWTKTCQDFCPV